MYRATIELYGARKCPFCFRTRFGILEVPCQLNVKLASGSEMAVICALSNCEVCLRFCIFLVDQMNDD